MKSFTLLSALGALSSVMAVPTATTENSTPAKRADLPAVSASGNAFYTEDGKRWYMRGIDYQPGGAAANIDPLSDSTLCKRDIEYFKDLGVNCIRVYAVDNSANHDECMQALSDAGIYLVLDVNNPKYSINRADPYLSYNAAYLQSVFATVEVFSKYKNTVAFFSGNEVINDEKNTDLSAPYVKAVTRDMKNYISSRNLRKVPVGYSAADVSSNRMETAHYLNCGSDDARSDFFAFNDYSWCNSDFQTSGWDQKVKNFTDYGIPIFLSEWGCNLNRPRKFEEIGAMMSDKMSAVYSGGLMYEYSKEENDFGIVEISNGKVEKLDEFDLFASALEKNPMPTGSGGAATSTHGVDCPQSASNWQVDPTSIPAMPKEAETYMKNGAGKGPGLKGSGSQTAGDSGLSTTNVTSGQPSPTGAGGNGNGDGAMSLSVGFIPMVVTSVILGSTIFGTMLL